MSEYDTWAPVYDAWAADMTEDVEHYVSLARSADGFRGEPFRDESLEFVYAARRQWA